MAKNNSKGGLEDFLILIILAVIAIIALIAVVVIPLALLLVPIALGILAFIKWKKWKKEMKIYPNKSIKDFWITSEEKVEYLNLLKKLKIVNEEVLKYENKLNEIKITAKNENISRNIDGSISNRSNRGKEINKHIYEYSKEIKSFKNIRYNINNEIWSLCRKPFKKWSNLKVSFSLYNALASALVIWFVAFHSALKYFFKSPLLALCEIYDHFILKSKKNIILKEDWQIKIIVVLIISLLVSICVYYISLYFSKKIFFKKKYNEPPIIDIYNYNLY
jgi:hypothetical protein